MAPMGRRDILALIQGRIPVRHHVPDSVAAVLRQVRAVMVAVTGAARPAVYLLHPLVVHTVAAAVLAVAHSVAVAAAPAVDSVEAVTLVAAVAVEAAAAGSLPA